VSVPKRYPEEFRRKVLDLVSAGRPVAQIANDLQISDQTIYDWRRQELIDTGQLARAQPCRSCRAKRGQQGHPRAGGRGLHPEKGP
jgi:transposase-like protein